MIHPLNLAEVLDRMARLVGADPDDVEADMALLGVAAVEIDEASLVDAGRWRARHYHRTDRAVSLADCVAAVTALAWRMPLATSDSHCAEMVREEGGEVFALPDSNGVKP